MEGVAGGCPRTGRTDLGAGVVDEEPDLEIGRPRAELVDQAGLVRSSGANAPGSVGADLVGDRLQHLRRRDEITTLTPSARSGACARFPGGTGDEGPVRSGRRSLQLRSCAWSTGLASRRAAWVGVGRQVASSHALHQREWRDAASGATFESHNPATGEDRHRGDAGVADVEAAAAARRRRVRGVDPHRPRVVGVPRPGPPADARAARGAAKLMTEEQGKPIRMARNEVGYAAASCSGSRRPSGSTETILSARADQRFLVLRQRSAWSRRSPVELSGVDAGGRSPALAAAARSCSSRPSRHAARGRVNCSRRSGCPRAW